ncbi:MAG: hypothetical protein VX325_04015 [Bacteroidota bacterium]|nr:hypothetical protein [Bacteroidota bacterium]
MIRYLSIINHRTLVTLLLSFALPFFTYKFRIVYNIDLTLISIAIIFPLVFAIRGAFRRREKALEHLSLYRGALRTIEYFFVNSANLGDDAKEKSKKLLVDLSNSFLDHLSQSDTNTKKIDEKTEAIFAFVRENEENIQGGTRQKIFRFIRDVHIAQENLLAIHTHRTPISLKAYCLIFIYLFPVIYTPAVVNKIGLDAVGSEPLTYFIVMLSEFILISLYNIQDQMEYPFDKDGLDDIKLDDFRINRNT